MAAKEVDEGPVKNRHGRLKRAAAAMASVSLATSGLSSCEDNGAVDPAPPPLQCDAVGAGQLLEAMAQRDGRQITVAVNTLTPGLWMSAEVLAPENLTAVGTELNTEFGPVRIMLELVSDSVTEASFTFAGVLRDISDDTVQCTVTRRFELIIRDNEVVVAQRASLPLQARQMPRLAIVEQRGRVVHIEAQTAYGGKSRAEWRVTAGSIQPISANRVRWTLPDAPGMYQIDVVMDYGVDGVGFDAIALEVDGSLSDS
jgi:hypothetical protein